MKNMVSISLVGAMVVFVNCGLDQGDEPQQQRPCPECSVCPDQPSDPCNGISFEGQCTEDGKVVWCEEGELQEIDCVAYGDTCGYDEELQYFDCLLESDEPAVASSSMNFTCTCGHILLDVQFALGEDGCIKGMLGYVKPEQVAKVRFFVDQQDISTAPSATYSVESNSATLELPGCSVTGNLFLTLRDDTQVWTDVGSFQLAGASVSGDYLVSSCGTGSECYCQ